MSCLVTVLSTNQLLCKTISAGKPYSFSDYDKAYTFSAFEIIVTGLDDLATLVTSLETERHHCIIRGGLTNYGRREIDANRLIRRTIRDRDNLPPTIEDHPRQWMMVDIDQFQIDDANDLVDDPVGVIERMVTATLPPEFHHATCFWQFSSTCGYRPGVAKAHLWYWLDQPLLSGDLKRWADGLELQIDQSVYVPHQIHYTAKPLLNDVSDVLPVRHGWCLGSSDTVTITVPPIPEPTLRTVLSGVVEYSSAIAHTLGTVGDGEGLDGFHAPLRKAAYLYSRSVISGQPRDDDGLIMLMMEVALAAPSNDGRGSERAREGYLRQLINSAMELS